MLDFLYGASQGVAGNLLTRVVDAFWPRLGNDSANALKSENMDVVPDEVIKKKRIFQTFHIKSGLEAVLDATIEPVVHIVLEDTPTSFHHLVVLVVESRVTGEWFVSSKGEMAFEGTGGGVRVSQLVSRLCSARRIPLAGWVCTQSASDSLSSGEILWPHLRPELVPLVAYSGGEHFLKNIASRYKELIT